KRQDEAQMSTQLDIPVATQVFFSALRELATKSGIDTQAEIRQLFSDYPRQNEMFMSIFLSVVQTAKDDPTVCPYIDMLKAKHKNMNVPQQVLKLSVEAFKKSIDAGGKALTLDEKDTLVTAYKEIVSQMATE
ncbi:hypothetical protein V5T82_18135, partial [Magnetovibrio sp. PR-2]|uniref:hypothetical protein n=1 Tax=Magnetovibrio sp. PR-2 TaxID=3120356 RepID=UPI002FCE2B67